MQSNALAGTAVPLHAKEPAFDRDAAVTRSLIGYGVLVGPFYLVVSLGQAFVRDGFDLTRHALSLLANGRGGWVQVVNLALSGLMVIATAVGLRRVLGPKSRAFMVFLCGFGASMVVASVFRADPMDGFPVGTPLGFPTTISTHGLIHFIAGALGFTSLGVSCLLAAVVMRRRNAMRLALFSLLAGLGVLFGFYGGMVFSSGGGVLGIWFAVVVGWAWLLVLSLHLYRVSRDPNCAPAAG